MKDIDSLNQFDRIKLRRAYIAKRFKDGDAIRVEDIATKFKVKSRTILKDLRYLRDLGIDIYSKKGVISIKETNRVNIIREIIFPAEFKSAGVSILSYFSEILDKKYPETDASVSIIQDGNNITLKIESEKGEIGRIEKTLEDYGKVVNGLIEPKEMMGNTVDSIELTNKLELVQMELRLKEQSFQALHGSQVEMISSLETQVTELRTLIGSQLGTVQSLSNIIQNLSENTKIPPAVSLAIRTVSELAKQNHNEENEEKLKTALNTIKVEDKALFTTITKSIVNFSTSIAANMSTPWVLAVINSLPK